MLLRSDACAAAGASACIAARWRRSVGLVRARRAHRCHTCAGTALAAATPAPGLTLAPLPHLRRDWRLHRLIGPTAARRRCRRSTSQRAPQDSGERPHVGVHARAAARRLRVCARDLRAGALRQGHVAAGSAISALPAVRAGRSRWTEALRLCSLVAREIVPCNSWRRTSSRMQQLEQQNATDSIAVNRWRRGSSTMWPTPCCAFSRPSTTRCASWCAGRQLGTCRVCAGVGSRVFEQYCECAAADWCERSNGVRLRVACVLW